MIYSPDFIEPVAAHEGHAILTRQQVHNYPNFFKTALDMFLLYNRPAKQHWKVWNPDNEQ
jgi:hypothetical protein